MNASIKAVVCTAFLALSASAFAAGKLTPQQCNDYPFKPLHGPVTHPQLMNELSELKSVGYDASKGSALDYPASLEEAEQRMHAKYETDCVVGGQQALSHQTTVSQ